MHSWNYKTRERYFKLKEKGFIPNNALDIGANVGVWVDIIRTVYPNLPILSIEANPNCEQQLSLKNPNYLITLLGSNTKDQTFHINSDDPLCTGASVYKENTDYYENPNSIVLPTQTLNDIGGVYDLIKIDVQGAELDILKGGMGVVTECKFLQCELPVMDYNKNGAKIGDIISFLQPYGFELYDIFEMNYYDEQLNQLDGIFINTRK
jgi:FkbM family methyltransferase